MKNFNSVYSVFFSTFAITIILLAKAVPTVAEEPLLTPSTSPTPLPTAPPESVSLLNENCVVNILNRTVQVAPNGGWSLPNVPSSQGRVRARATCVDTEGNTYSGQSDYFSLITNEVVSVGEIHFESLDPIPTEIDFSATDNIEIYSIGGTYQLSVTAEFADGSSSDVTSVSSGINYTSSNTAVITISPDGLVTAIANGFALVSARKDGVLATRGVLVTTSGDLDGDGIPDDFETANGMNPNDPVDAFEDVDGDGLSALEEFNLGTDIQDPDTDGDGIDDGEEIETGSDGFITSPLLDDTDSDGLNDSLEIAIGSSPSDGGDANYAAALVGIDVTPKNSVIYYNSIDGESSIQLRVEGEMIDGSLVDLTELARGTSYTSADLTIANMGLTPGQIFAGVDGVADITVTNASFSDVARVTVITFTPTAVTYLDLPSNGTDLTVDGDYLYVSAGPQGLYVVNVNDVEAPSLLTSYPLAGNTLDVVVEGDYAYVATSDGLSILLKTNPANLLPVGAVATPGAAQDIALSGNYVYVADGGALVIIDRSNLAAPAIVGSIDVAGARGVSVENGVASVATSNEIVTVDVTDPALPAILGNVSVGAPRDVIVKDGYAHTPNHSSGRYRVVDVNTPASPQNIAGLSDFIPFDVAISGDLAFFAEQLFVSAMPFVNISNPDAPVYQGIINMSQFGDSDCSSIDVTDTYAYCIAGRRLFTAQYRGLVDNAGIAPTVLLDAPVMGTTLHQERPYRIRAIANDDIRVASVNFYVDGVAVHSDATLPYEFVYRVPASITSLSLRVVALDLAGNEGTTSDLDFDVDAVTVLEEDWQGVDIDFFDDDLLAASVYMFNANFISDHALTSIGDFTVEGLGQSTIKTSQLDIEGDLIIDGTSLVIDTANPVNVLGDVRIINGGSLSVIDADAGTSTLNSLDLQINGSLLVDALSSIDLDGKGYPANYYSGPDFSNNTRAGCHGGARSNTTSDCTYGSYRKAEFAGSAGVAQGSGVAHGGGLTNIQAASIQIDGVIKANGLRGNSSVGGGAGGGIHLEAPLITGAGSIEVRGGTYYAGGNNHTGGGGRISIFSADTSGFAGQLVTGSGQGGLASGAGTAFIKDPGQRYGRLLIDNAGDAAPANSTRLRQVGIHTIVSVQDLGGDQWEIGVAGNPWTASNAALGWGLQGIEVDLDASDTAGARYTILSNTINSIVVGTADDLSLTVDNQLIGVHTFKSLSLTGGAWLSVGDDRLDIIEIPSSIIGSGATVSAGSLQQNVVELALSNGGGIVTEQAITIVEMNIVGGGSPVISAPALNILGNATIDGMSVVLDVDEPLLVGGDLNLLNGAILTVPNSTVTPAEINALVIDVAGTLTVDGTSAIDLNGKGYPSNFYSGPDFSNNTRSSCHGGFRANANASCVYGRYQRARFAGSAGRSYDATRNGRGGGLLEVYADTLQLDGVITANANGGYYFEGGGAGGGIHLDVVTLAGGGALQANAGTNAYNGTYPTGGGGRISLYVQDRSGFTGTYIASTTSGGLPGGAGTVFLKDVGSSYGHLVVDNGGLISVSGGTPIQAVGRHSIVSVYEATPGVWRVEVEGAPWQLPNEELDIGLIGMEVDLDADETLSAHYTVVDHTTNSLTLHTSDNLHAIIGSQLVGVHTLDSLQVLGGASLDFGEDRVVVLDTANSLIASNSTLAFGDAGSQVLDIPTGVGAQFVQRNAGSILNWDLSSLTGQVITFDAAVARDTLNIAGGTVNFDGGLTLTGDLIIGAGTTVSASAITASNMNVTDATVTSASIVADALNLDNVVLTSGDIQTSTDVILSNASHLMGLQSNGSEVFPLNINVAGILNVDATSTIDVVGRGYPSNFISGPDFSNNTRSGCHAGIRSDTTPACSYGRYQQARFAGSAGRSYNAANNGYGGGLIKISADTFVLDGGILADANGGYYFEGGGAGGSIHVSVINLSGIGSFSANGGLNQYAGTYPAGGGGRISIYTTDRSGFIGTWLAQSGSTGAGAGAGTVYVKDAAQTFGHLFINNGGYSSPENGTPVRTVGKHVIEGVYEATPGVWRIEVAGTPWRPSDPALDWGLNGIEIDLDASEALSLHYVIDSNTENTLTILTNDDLLAVLSNGLIGVHSFQSIAVLNGAWLDFGEDRLLIVDPGSSSLDIASTLSFGEADQSILQIPDGNIIQRNNSEINLWDLSNLSGRTVEFTSLVSTDTLTISGGTVNFLAGVELTGSLNISGNAIVDTPHINATDIFIADAAVTSASIVAENIDLDNSTLVVGNILLGNDLVLANSANLMGLQSTSSEVSALVINVVGTVSVDATSVIDVTGRGYPSNFFSGPDFSNNTRPGCHAGIRSNSGVACSYGRYERARFAGSAGRSISAVNNGYGGGLVELFADTLVLDGSLLADGVTGYYLEGGGAGGGIHVDVVSLSGGGSISANGGANQYAGTYPAGGGGRISIYSADRLGFSGSWVAQSGSSGAGGGAGTVYVKDVAQTHGHLIINNGDLTSPTNGTPVRSVGKRVIDGVYEATPGVWRVEVAGAPWRATDVELDWGLDGIEVDLDASETFSSHYRIESNTENTLTIFTTDNLLAVLGNELVGVHTLQSVAIIGGGWLDFGEDRVQILDTASSQISANSLLSFGEADQQLLDIPTAAGGRLISRSGLVGGFWDLSALNGQVLEFNGPVNTGSVHISGGTVTFNNDVTLTGNLDIDNASAEFALGLIAADMSVDQSNIISPSVSVNRLDVTESTVTTEIVSVATEANLLSNSSVTVQFATVAPNEVFGLSMAIAGTLTIDASSMVDLNGKGYPNNYYSGPDFSNNTRASCHGGKRANTTGNCTYGRFEVAQFAGSAGRYYNASLTARGGGVAQIQADQLSLEGVIRANAAGGYYLEGGGAGGGLHLEVATLLGAGSITANGGGNAYAGTYPAGAGGRISVYGADLTGFTGNYVAQSGASGAAAGAGTVFLNDTDEAYGNLIIDNGGLVAPIDSTPLRVVGEHIITDAQEMMLGIWNITVEGTPWVATDVVNGWGLDGLEVDLDASETLGAHYSVLSNTENVLTVASGDELSAVIGNTLVGVHTFNSLIVANGADEDFGADRVVELASQPVDTDGDGLTDDEEINVYLTDASNIDTDGDKVPDGLEVLLGLSPTDNTSADVSANAQGIIVTPASIDVEFVTGILPVELSVTADVVFAGTHYPVDVSDQAYSSVAYLSSNVLVSSSLGDGIFSIDGVGTADLNVSYGAFSTDVPLTVTVPLDVDWTDQVVALDRDTVLNSLVLDGSTVSSSNGLLVLGNMSAAGLNPSALSANSLMIDGDLVIDGVSLSLDVPGDIEIAGNLQIINGGTLTVPFATASPAELKTLALVVSGTVDIDASSQIDVSGKGYPSSNFSGPDFSTARPACHGGIRSNTSTDCSYGRFERAAFAGSAGYFQSATNHGRGGGLLQLTASALVLEGSLVANGGPSYYYGNGSGAGGGIHVEVTDLSGAGTIAAAGGAQTYGSRPSGAGGRVSMNVVDRSSFTGGFNVAGSSGGAVAGAGTAYVKVVGETHGHLIVDNAGRTANTGSTPIRRIGRHLITGVDEVAPNVWRVEVEANPWRASDPALGWGIDGIMVDLDAGELLGAHYEVDSNSSNTITVLTSDDLSAIVGNELVGVQQFETLTVIGGASVDFGDDRIDINDATNSIISSALSVGHLNQSLIDSVSDVSGGGRLLVSNAMDLTGLDLTVLASDSVLEFKQAVTADSLEITGGTLLFESDLVVYGALNLNNGASLVTPNLSASEIIVTDALNLSAAVINAQSLSAQNSLLSADTISLLSDMTLANNSSLTTFDATSTPQMLYPLAISVLGTVSIDATSQIDVSGKGYPASNFSGPDFSTARPACHGGIRSNTSTDCTYGRFERAAFAGSAGYYQSATNHGRGGGLLQLTASALVLEGSLVANGGPSYYYGNGSGAGGGIHLEVTDLSGAGTIAAAGGTQSYSSRPSGAGGRVSMNVVDRSSFTGGFNVAGSSGGAVAGAGTAYVKVVGETHGHLIVDNAGRAANAGSTPIRRIGRHLITGVDEVAPNVWRVEVEANPWRASDPALGWGIDGIMVDLDAGELLGAHYEVDSNSSNTITVLTSDDLSAIVGNELVGVHQFEMLTVIGGASVDFGDDRVEINDATNSIINGVLRVGQLNQGLIDSASDVSGGGRLLVSNAMDLTGLDLSVLASDSVLQFEQAVTSDTAQISSGQVLFDAGATVAGDLIFDNQVVVNTLAIEAANLIISGATINTDSISVAGDLSVLDNSLLSVSFATSSPQRIHTLDINVGGIVTVDATSSIDVSGKGYPSSNFSGPDFSTARPACHGGIRSNTSTDCTYGRFERAAFAGSAGYYQSATNHGRGGGLLQLTASALVLEGSLLANGGASYYYGNGSGAGGGIHIEVANLSGAGTFASAAGTQSYGGRPSGGGGRISVYVDDWIGFTGDFNVAGSTGGAVAGAGTAYVKVLGETHGHLISDNAGRAANAGSTPVRNVGRRLITGVDEVLPGVWLVEVEGTPWVASDPALGWGIDGIMVDLDASELLSAHYEIGSNSANTITLLTSDDLSGILGNELVGVHQFETLSVTGGAAVDFGDDRVEVNDAANSQISAVLKVGQINQSLIDSASDVSGGTLIVTQVDDLSGLDLTGLNATTVFRFDSAVTTDTLTVVGGNLAFNAGLTVTGDASLVDTMVSATSLDANNILADNVELSGQLITAINDISLLNGALFTVQVATSSPQQLFAMDLSVGGTLSIDGSSNIDVSTKGYPATNFSGPDFTTDRPACHGGLRSNTSADCSYGRYEQAKFAGSAGHFYNAGNPGQGGGFVSISATTLLLDGGILANGGQSYYYGNGSGAGGGIHIAAVSLSGTGAIAAQGGFQAYGGRPSGGGGRISIYVDDWSGFSGAFNVASGSGGAVAGAGTAFVKLTGESHGRLLIDNGGRVANVGSTPIRSVGRHSITSVAVVGVDEWQIEVDGEPWRASDESLDWGLIGIMVDLDASEEISSHYQIISNTGNTLTVMTSDDLTPVVGNELVGVHTFETVVVGGGGYVEFGDDRVYINDVLNSGVDGSSGLGAGLIDQDVLQALLGSDSQINVSTTINATNLTLSNISNASISAPELIISGDLLLDNAQVNLAIGGAVVVGNDIDLINGASLTVPSSTSSPQHINYLAIEAAGAVVIDVTSSIDVSAKGYPASHLSGPDFTTDRPGCHGGMRSSTTIDCTYGRYEQASFAGSAGYFYNAANPGHGGGFVSLSASSLLLDGGILANGGQSYYNDHGSGAGGGIHIDVISLSGSGAFAAAGGLQSYGGRPSGGGGRISVYVDDWSGFSGDFDVASGSGGAVAGAGTVFVKVSAESHGRLRVDNGGRIANAGSTPIRSVGRHVILAATLVGLDEWLIEVDGTPWQATAPLLAWGVDGILVDLDASEDISSHYQIDSNSENTLTVMTGDDLSSVVGNELIGVHTFETVNVSDGASVDFGDDRVFLNDLVNSGVDGNSDFSAGVVDQDVLQSLLRSDSRISLSEEVKATDLTLSNISNATVLTPALSVSGDLSFDNAQVSFGVANTVTVGNDVDLLNGSSLSVPTATSSPQQLNYLAIDAVGAVIIDASSNIDVSAKGYPASHFSGPDFTTDRPGCHGGMRSSAASDCTYGRFEQASFAGSAGYFYNAANPGHGGGFVSLVAGSLQLDGSILANGGQSYYYNNGSGAGGGVHVDVASFSGSGAIEAVGGLQTIGGRPSGGGGRVSVYTDDNSGFVGSYLASTGAGGAVGGAGTIFIKLSSESYGHLTVDNNGRTSPVGFTPLRAVGLHLITAASLVDTDTWEIQVSGTPWITTDSAMGWGLDGLDVDLDASETLGSHYRIVENTDNTLTLETSDDLSSVVGSELVGVHTFESMTESGGASIDFGGDRAVVLP